jgi:peptide-methionine (R)-S-oxide reductase
MLGWIDVLYYTKYSNPEPYRRLNKTEEEWKEQLTAAQYHVMREKGTEKAFRNTYCRTYDSGIYACRGCGSKLFSSSSKYKSLSGWPGFSQPIAKAAVKYAFDDSHNMSRIEAMCNVCDSHLGHVFPHGPEPAALRYCINSESIVLIAETAL